MKHPIVRLFLARLRALAAVGRAAFPVVGLPAFLTPFARHVLRIERVADGSFVIVETGEAVATLFARTIVGRPFTELFREEDRARVEALLAATCADRIACLFGAEARFRYRVTAIEAMIVPEPLDDGVPIRASACLVSIGFPRGWGSRPLPPLTLRSERFVDLDGLSGGAATKRSTIAWRALRKTDA